MKYPYPKKAILKSKASDSYKDGGTLIFNVINKSSVGIEKIYQDFRIHSSSKGKFYTAYPGDKDAEEIIDSFIIFQD